MAFAYCPACRKSFRFRASAEGGSPWLKQVAKSLGKGERPVLFCYSCWVEPEVGDRVVIIDPPYENPCIQPGAVGRVVELLEQEARSPLFVVEGLANGQPWRCTLRRRQLKASEPPLNGTPSLVLRSKPASENSPQ